MTSLWSPGRRKMVATLAMLGIGTAVMGVKGDVPSNFLTLMITLFSVFVAGNGIEHAADAMTARAEAAAPAPAAPAEATDLSPVTGAVAQLQAHAEATNQALTSIQDGLALVQKSQGFIIQRAGLAGPA